MSSDSLNNVNVSIQLENWLEKHSRSYPRRWLKRYFIFDGEYLSYSKSDSSKSPEKYKVGISDISDIKMKVNSDGKNVLIVIVKSGEVGNSNENELEISMPNQQILKIWYNSIKECIENNAKLKVLKTSGCNLNKNIDVIKSADEIHANLNKPLPQPNIHKNSSNVTLNSSNNSNSLPEKTNSNENINKKSHPEKSSALSKLDALLGDIQHSMQLSDVERKSVLILNNYEKIGLSPLSNTTESSPLKQNYIVNNYDEQNKEENNSPSNRNKNLLKDLKSDYDKKLKTSSMPPNENKSNEDISMNCRFNLSDPSLSPNRNFLNYTECVGTNRKNTLVKEYGRNTTENDELISDINKKINLNMYSERDGSNPKSNSYVYNMAINNYVENESRSRNNSGNFENYDFNVNNKTKVNITSKSNHSSNAICSPIINKPKQQFEIYTQFETSLNSSLDIVNILLQILDISTDSIDKYFTEYKEVILTVILLDVMKSKVIFFLLTSKE